MSRIKNFSKNLVASYGQLGVNVLYSLVSIPLILKYLPKEEFGLWATLMQLVGYFALVDFGMTSAAARLLVDHKDSRFDGNYGSMVKTTFLVCSLQGMVIFLLCVGSTPLVSAIIKIPVSQAHLFQQLFFYQGLLVASSFVFRPFGIILYAYQKEYVPILVGTVTLLISLPILWCLLALKYGVFSFIYANLCMGIVTPLCLFLNCWRRGMLPSGNEWGKVTKKHFLQVFGYGKDIFLMNMGFQMVNASQIIIVSRCLGLDSAAIWAVGTKMFNLIIPLMSRPYGAAIPGMSELLVREEHERLYDRFRKIVVLTCSLGVFLGISYALCNSVFVTLWTHGRISWSPLNDLLLGILVILSSMQTTHTYFVSITKQIGGMRYIFFAEGFCFIILGLLGAEHFGMIGLIAASLVCMLLFSYQYSLRLSCKYFHERILDIAVGWIAPSLKFAALYLPLALIIWFSTSWASLSIRFFLNSTMAILVGGILFLRVGLTHSMKYEIGNHIPASLTKMWRLTAIG